VNIGERAAFGHDDERAWEGQEKTTTSQRAWQQGSFEEL